MNKPIIMVAMAALAVLVSSTAASLSVANAQYPGGAGGGTATPEQLKECQQIGIPEGNCNDVTILAKRRVLDAQTTTYGNQAYGSGTPYFQGIETWGVIGALAAIFGGVAAAFFFKGRGAKPIST